MGPTMNDVKYLNVDLEIDSAADLTPIVEEFGEDVSVMYNGDWGLHKRAAFEIDGSHASANEHMEYFCTLIDSLSEEPREADPTRIRFGLPACCDGVCLRSTVHPDLLADS